MRLDQVTSKSNIRDFYNFHRVLGSGGFGIVKLASLKSNPNKMIAVKMVERAKLRDKEYMLLRELDILKTLDHPNIIKFYEVFSDKMWIYFCMEYCQGGELLERITQKKFFKEREAVRIMRKILSAVTHMHARKIVHRDLKPENILFLTDEAESEIKIIDFGLSAKCSPTDSKGMKT